MSNLLQITLNHVGRSSFNVTTTIVRSQSVLPTTLKKLSDCIISNNLWSHAFISWKQYNVVKNFCQRAHDVDTNVTKDVILFKYENPRFYKILNIFALSQFIFWSYLSHFAYTTLRDAPVDQQTEQKDEKKLAWYEKINLGDNKYRNGITIMSFLIGYGILFVSWTYTLHSVRFLILRKGGKKASLVTYTPFGHNRILTVPLNHISAQQSREMASEQLPLKVRNKMLFYILNMRGEFKNSKLYDQTVGINRHF